MRSEYVSSTRVVNRQSQVWSTFRLTSRTLKEYDELLAEQGFYRIHRAHLVNKKYISSFTNDHNLQLTDGSEVEVSRRKWDEVKKILLQ